MSILFLWGPGWACGVTCFWRWPWSCRPLHRVLWHNHRQYGPSNTQSLKRGRQAGPGRSLHFFVKMSGYMSKTRSCPILRQFVTLLHKHDGGLKGVSLKQLRQWMFSSTTISTRYSGKRHSRFILRVPTRFTFWERSNLQLTFPDYRSL